jgi:hypothetical protein
MTCAAVSSLGRSQPRVGGMYFMNPIGLRPAHARRLNPGRSAEFLTVRICAPPEQVVQNLLLLVHYMYVSWQNRLYLVYSKCYSAERDHRSVFMVLKSTNDSQTYAGVAFTFIPS